MKYQIIETQTSANERICYSLFQRVKSLETLTACTYGIIAADSDGSFSVDDITTDESEAKLLMKTLCAKSVRPKEFLPYVVQFLDAV